MKLEDVKIAFHANLDQKRGTGVRATRLPTFHNLGKYSFSNHEVQDFDKKYPDFLEY